MRPSSEDASRGSTSKWPQRLVSPSTQLWIWLFGASPVVESVWIVSDIDPATDLIRIVPGAGRGLPSRSRDISLELGRSLGASATAPSAILNRQSSALVAAPSRGT